jgi:hypothetical protein
VNGIGTTVLIDTGAEVDLVSPDFLENCKGPEVYRLKTPLGLGMAVEGSASPVNYGAFLEFAVDKFSTCHYFNVQRCQKVDIVVDLPFLSKYQATISLGDN